MNPNNPVTVSEAFRRFILSLERKRREPRTIKTYHQRLGRFVEMFGTMSLADLTANEIDDWLDEYVTQSERFESHPTRPNVNGRLANATIRGYVQSIKTFIRFCDTRYGDELPWRRLPTAHIGRPPKKKKSERENAAARPEDFLAMMKRCRWQPRDRAMLAFLGDTAVRAGELASVRISDVDFERNLAKVKGKTGVREVDFTHETAEYIWDWLELRPETDHEFLFVALNNRYLGSPITIQGIYLTCKRLAKEAKISGHWNPQAIRRMTGQMWADAGINPERIQLKLGHSDIKTTLDWYTFQDMDRVRQTTQEMSLVKQFEATEVQRRKKLRSMRHGSGTTEQVPVV
jgi:integrase